MMRYPILYPGNWSNFQSLGVGYMRDAISSKVKEVRNGAFELTVVYPVTGILYPAIELNGFIRVKPNDIDDSHIFRIDEIEPDKSSGTIEITASSKTNDLNGAFIKHMKQVSATGQVVLDAMRESTVEPCDYLFETDITLLENITWDNRNVLNCLSGSQGSFIDVYGGEILRTDDTIYIYRQRGKDRAVTIRSGKNLKGFKMNTSFVGKYTRIIPRLEYELEDPVIKPKDSNPSADNTEVSSSDNSENKFEHYSPIVISDKEAGYPVTAHRLTDWDMSQYKPITDYIAARNKEIQNAKKASDKIVQDGGNSNAETLKIIKLRDEKKAQINAEMDKLSKNYFKSINPGCDTPNVKLTIDVVQISDSIERGILFELEHIGLCDRVRVYIPDYNINLVLPVTTVEYDSLRRRVVKITVESLSGSGNKSLADSLKAEYKDLRAENERIKNQMAEEATKLRKQISKSADGRTNIYHGPDAPPGANFKVGDIWWKESSAGQVEMWVWDGSKWVQKLYKGMGEDLNAYINSVKQEIERSFDKSDKATQAKIEGILSNANANKQAIDEIRSQQLTNKTVVDGIRNSLNTISSEFRTSIGNAVASTTSLTNDLNNEKRKITEIISNVSILRASQESSLRDIRTLQESSTRELRDAKNSLDTLKGVVEKNKADIIATNNRFGSYITAATYNTLEGTVRRNQTTLEQTVNGLTSLATKDSVNTLKGTVDRESTRLTQTINGLNVYATKDSFNQLTGIVNNTKASLDVTNNTIRTLATKDSVNQLTGDVQTAKSKWEQTAEGFSLDISRLKNVNSNLIPADKWSTASFNSNNDVALFGHRFKYEKVVDTSLPSGYFYRVTILALSNNRRNAGVIIEDLRHLCHTNGRKASTSIYARSNRDIMIHNFGFENGMQANDVTLNNQWQMITATGIPRDNVADAFVMYNPDRDYVVGQTFDIWGPTLVLGDTPIDPKMAFNSISDSKLESAKSEIKATTDRISAQVSSIDTSVRDNVNQLRSSIELTNSKFNTVVSRNDFNTATGRINNLESRQTQLDNRISQVITETKVNDLINNKGFVTNAVLQSKLDQTSNSLTSRITEVTTKIPKTVSHRNLVSTSTIPNWTEYETHSNPVNACFGGWSIPWADQTGIFPGVKINLKIHVSVDEVRRNNNDTMICRLQTGEIRSGNWMWGSPSPFSHERTLSLGNNYYVIELSTVVTHQMYNGYDGMFMNFRVDGTSYFKAHIKGLIITTGDIPPTEWTMPVENLATTSRITEVIQSIDGVKTTVAGAQNSINQLNIKSDSTNQRISSLDSTMTNRFNAVNDTILSHTRTLSDQNNRLSQVIQTADGLVNRVYSSPAVNLLPKIAWESAGYEQGGTANWGQGKSKWNMELKWVDDSTYRGNVLRWSSTADNNEGFYCRPPEASNIISKYKREGKSMSFAVYARANRELGFRNIGFEPNLQIDKTIGTKWTLLTNSVDRVAGSEVTAFTFYGSKQSFRAGDWIELRGMTLADGKCTPDPNTYVDGSSEKVNAIETRVSQLAGSWAVQNLNRNGDIISQINANSDGNVRIAGNKVSITGTTYIENSVIDSSKIRNLDVGKITGMDANFLQGRIGMLDVNRISGMSGDFLMAKIGEAWIQKLRGKIIWAQNDGMSIDLNNSYINLYNSESAIVRRKGTHTAFLHFNDVTASSDGGAGSVYVGLGVTSSGDGINSMSSGRFSGMRIFRAAHGNNHTATLDQAEIYGDTIYLKDTFDISRGFEFEVSQLPVGKVINMNRLYTSVVSLWRCWLHANNVGFDFNNNDLKNAIRNEYNNNGGNI